MKENSGVTTTNGKLANCKKSAGITIAGKKNDLSELSDKEIVCAILNRDAIITRLFLYEKCYPLFKARYEKYYTDCETCVEFINEIYTYIMTPGVKTGKCYLSTFGFSCSLICWLKIVVENYCRQLYKKKIEYIDATYTQYDESVDIPSSENVGNTGNRKMPMHDSIDIDSLNRYDVNIVLGIMPNKRYSEETAEILGMSMDNYYNKHKLAKEQFAKILRKEGLI